MPRFTKNSIRATKIWSPLNFLITVLAVAGVIVSGGLSFLSLFSPSYQSPFTIDKSYFIKKNSLITSQFTISRYNVIKKQEFINDSKLQNIVNEIVLMVDKKGLPSEALSISFMDLSDSKNIRLSGYRNGESRFPASISKLFWMVMFYANLNANALKDEEVYNQDLYKMIQKSDNEAASRFIDQLTGTISGKELSIKDYEIWLEKRKRLNDFFQAAGYTNINICQKNFPIPYLNLSEPEGREEQLRGSLSHPIRNQMTTDQAARLMHEIFTNQAVSPEYSLKMQKLLLRDLRPEVWKQELYNSIEGFLGESLPYQQIYFASKVGWTSGSRQEVAFIATKDGKTRYILVIFGDHPAYANDWKLFPDISLYVFNKMHQTS